MYSLLYQLKHAAGEIVFPTVRIHFVRETSYNYIENPEIRNKWCSAVIAGKIPQSHRGNETTAKSQNCPKIDFGSYIFSLSVDLHR